MIRAGGRFREVTRMDVGVGAAFVAGVLSFLSPCVLPLVPPYLTWLAGSSLEELAGAERPDGLTGRVMVRALAFVAGFGVVFVALGASATALGALLLDHIGIASKIAGVLIILFGLHFLGLFKIGLLYRQAKFDVAQQPPGLLSAFILGLAFAFGWTPCVGPVLASILMVASAKESAGGGALLLAAYAVGIGLPFLLAALFVRPFLGFLARFRRHLGMVEKAMGAVLVIAGLLILTGRMADVGGWLLETFPALGRIG